MKRITYVEDVALVAIKNCPAHINFFADVMGRVGRASVDVDMITQSTPSGGHIDLFFTIADSDIPLLLNVTSTISSDYPTVKVSINGSNCKVSVFDDTMVGTPGYAADVFDKAAKANVDIRLISTSENDISMLIVNQGLQPLLDALDEKKPIR